MTIRKKASTGTMGKYSKVIHLRKVSLEEENDLKLPRKRDGIGEKEGCSEKKVNQHMVQEDWRKLSGL